jgi:hypothetical protein
VHHLAAFYEDVDPAGALVTIAAVREETLFTNGPDLRVPTQLPNIIGAAALGNDASFARAQVQSPSLRILANLDVEPCVAALVFGSPPEESFWPVTPVGLTPDEALNFAVESNPAAGEVHHGLVVLADGPQLPVEGRIFTVRTTGAAALAAGAWVNTNLTFAQTLPAGRYQVVGMRARGTNLVAARLVFPEQVARPGVLAVNALADQDPYWTRFGRMGVFGEFPHTNPPTLDCLGVTDTSQVILLDLIRVA